MSSRPRRLPAEPGRLFQPRLGLVLGLRVSFGVRIAAAVEPGDSAKQPRGSPGTFA